MKTNLHASLRRPEQVAQGATLAMPFGRQVTR
jgi:hypothetical protein